MLPGEPVEEPGEGAELAVKRLVGVPERKVHDTHGRGGRGRVPLPRHNPPDRPQEEIDEEHPIRRHLLGPPGQVFLGHQDRTDVDRPPKGRPVASQVAVSDERAHRRPVFLMSWFVSLRVTVRVVQS
jgi:hypothetical protein